MFFLQNENKIKNSRFDERLNAPYLMKFQRAGLARTTLTNLKNISAGGFNFSTDRPLQKGAVLNVSISLPPLDRVIEAQSEVIRIRKSRKTSIYDVVARFVELPDEEKITLRELTARSSKIYSREEGF